MSGKRKMTLAALLLLLALTIFLWPAREASLRQKETTARNSAARDSKARDATALAGADDSRVRKLRPHDAPRKSRFLEMVKRFTGESSSGESSPLLSSQQIEAYLTKENRSRGALLAAYQITNDRAFLKEALNKFPKDPQLLLASAHLEDDPAKRLEIYDRMRGEDPGNGLVDLVSAKALFDLGKNEEALARLCQGAGNPLNDFCQNTWQNTEEAYVLAGYSAVEAKLLGAFSVTKPDIIQSVDVSKKLRELKVAYKATGDEESVAQVDATQNALAGQHAKGLSLVDQMVGLVYEKSILKDDLSEEANRARADIELRREAIKTSGEKVGVLMKSNTISESDWGSYFDRMKVLGEASAISWLLEKYPQP
jgi:hypothetical protein